VIIAEAISRTQLRELTKVLRKYSGYKDELHFPIVKFVEHKMPKLFSGFSFEVKPKNYFPANIHAETDIKKRVIRVREDIYLGAINGIGRDRMTIAHEIGHYILLVVKGQKFYRSFKITEIEAYRDPEWQAKAFAAELLCPYHLIKGMAAYQIALACGVSEQAASYQYKIIN